MHPETQWYIRHGTKADAVALATFAARTFSETYGGDNAASDMHVHLERSFGNRQQSAELADPALTTLVALEGEALLAYAQLRRAELPLRLGREDPIELQRFYTDRSVHGRGLAQALMTAVRHAAQELGGKHCWLSVWEQNPRAIAFYKKAGFQDVGSTDFVVGTDRQRDRVLVREIP